MPAKQYLSKLTASHFSTLNMKNCFVSFLLSVIFHLIVDSHFHPSRALTRSLESFTPLTWMIFCSVAEGEGEMLDTTTYPTKLLSNIEDKKINNKT